MLTYSFHGARLIAGTVSAVMLMAATAISSVQAQQAVLPMDADDTHLGVATCAGSTCHGAPQPFDTSTVLQNEFVTWHREDRHYVDWRCGGPLMPDSHSGEWHDAE